ncbi:hypothetical protein RQP46_010771 [Phenoliferia psychrophenolica]
MAPISYYQIWGDELSLLAKNFFLYKRAWSKQDKIDLLARMDNGGGLAALGWDFESAHEPLLEVLLRRISKLRSGFQTVTLSAAEQFAIQWLSSKAGVKWRQLNARYKVVNGATEPNLPPVALLHPAYTTIEVTKTVFASCLTACDSSALFSAGLADGSPLKAIQLQLRRAASSLVAMEVFNQWDAVSLDGSHTTEVKTPRAKDVCATVLGAYDGLTAKLDLYDEPILYPFPVKAETKGKGVRVPFTHEVDAYENLAFD